MAREVDKVVRSLTELRPTAILEFFEVITPGDGATILRIHGGANVKEDYLEGEDPNDPASEKTIIAKSITWAGNEYYPMAIESSGFETTSTNRLPRPKIRISNIYYIVSMFLRDYDNLKDSKLIRTKVFLKYLDHKNFGNGPNNSPENPYGTPDPEAIISRDEYIISQKTTETKNFVEFELNSPLDLENADTLKRLIVGRYCSWKYRGFGCRFNETYPVCKIDNSDFSCDPNYTNRAADAEAKWTYKKIYKPGDIVYINDKNEILDYLDGSPVYRKIYYVAKNGDSCAPSNEFESLIHPGSDEDHWEQDACSKTIEGCKRRFHELPPSQVDTMGSASAIDPMAPYNEPLPFGGFPGTDNYYYGN
jgi:lambda family phage minor tail protein L